MPQWGERGGAALPPVGAPGNVLTSDGTSWSSQPPSGGSGSSYDYVNGAPALTWTVTHNLGFYPNVQARDPLGRVVECGVEHSSVNVLLLHFLLPTDGTARCS